LVLISTLIPSMLDDGRFQLRQLPGAERSGDALL